MADESIINYKKPGFPTTSNTEKSYQTTIEYVGPLSTLSSNEPPANTEWGNYDGVVVSTTLVPLPGEASMAELTVITEYFYESDFDGPPGEEKVVTYEVEWVMFQRSMLEHPVFQVDGSGLYVLEAIDLSDIEAWKNESNRTLKSEFKYNELALTGSGGTADLSPNATKFCEGLNLGLETYEDYAPVVRRTTTYALGLPSTSEAGLKDDPPGFTGKPTGYEWRKTSDRAIKVGGQTRWDRIEEWIGAVKVLYDKEEIFW